MPQRHFTNVAEFKDKYDTVRTVRKRSVNTTRMSLQRTSATPILKLNRAVARIAGQKIREARQKAGLTLEQLGTKAALTGAKNRMYEIENCVSDGLRIGTLYAIAFALGVEPWSLTPTCAEALDAAGVESQTVESLVAKG